MQILWGTLIFCIVLFIYVHVYHHLRTSDDLEIYEIDSCSKEQLEDLCDLRQPVLFKFFDEDLYRNFTRRKLIEDYGAFDVKIRDVTIKPSGETELFMPISLNGLMDSLSNKDERKYLTECNEEFIEETGLIKVLKSSDMFLRPGNLARGVYDLCIGGDEVTTPLRYDINYRNYILVTEGEIKLMLSPPKSGKYLFKDLDYENLEFRSPINPWMVQEHYKHDFDKVKCLELTVKKGDIIYIPAYWWYSIKYLDNSTCIKFKYTTYMNFVAIIPELCMNLLQNQNIKRVIAPQLELNNYKTK